MNSKKKTGFMWTNLSFGFSLLFPIFGMIDSAIVGVDTTQELFPQLIFIAGVLVIWILFSNHLKKAQALEIL